MGPLGWLGLIVLGIALHWAINLTFTYSPTFRSANLQFGQRSILQYTVYATAWMLIVIGVVWPIGLTAGWVIIALCILGMTVHQYRRREAQSLLWLLGLAMEKGIPANKIVRAFARERCDEVGCRANRLAKMLEQGVPLDTALQETRHRLPADAQLAISMDASTKATGHLVYETMQRQVETDLEVHPHLHQLFYLVVVTSVAFNVLAFIVLRCSPVFFQVLQDFAVPTNEVTGSAMVFANRLASYAWLTLGIGVLISLIVLVELLHYLGWTSWEPLVVRRFTRRYHASVVLRTLAAQVESQIPIPTSLEAMSKKYPRPHIRARLQSATKGVRLGRPWQDCLQAANLISKCDAAVLRSAENVGNLTWALEEISNGIIRRLRYRLLIWMRLLTPLVLVVLAVIVGFTGVAIFSSIRDLIFSVTP